MTASQKIRALIIDDEQGCISNLQYHLTRYCPDIQVVATGNCLQDAICIFNKESLDVAFLDIELFSESIFEAFPHIRQKTLKIVFVTAHNKYAIKAIKAEAIDYILKPLTAADIIDCYTRIKNSIRCEKPVSPDQLDGGRDIILQQGDKIYIIKSKELLYFEAHQFYTTVYFLYNGEKKRVVLSKIIGKIEDMYQDGHLFRIHKSYIINARQIQDVIKTGSMAVKMKTGDVLPIAKRRITEFIAFCTRHNTASV